MKDVTPQNNWMILIKSIAFSIGTVAIIALLKIAFYAFLSVSILILPLVLIYFLIFKFLNKK